MAQEVFDAASFVTGLRLYPPRLGANDRPGDCARAMNRDLYWKPNVLLESGQAVVGILDVLHKRVMVDGERGGGIPGLPTDSDSR